MCLNPITIQNNRLDYDRFVHKKYLQVPCGECDECRKQRIQQFATRLTFENYATIKAGGHNVFLTFSYNNAHLPYLCYGGYGYKEAVKCFDSKHILYLLRALHRHYAKKGLKFKHFVCSEYGDTTKRPHYHGLFNLPAEIDPLEFAERARKYWTKGIYGKLGFMFPSASDCRVFNKHIVRSDSSAGRYVAKYAVKDLSFYKLPIIKIISKDKVLKSQYHDYLPKTYISCNLGVSALPLVKVDSQYLLCPFTGKKLTIPRYYFDKLSYNIKQHVGDNRKFTFSKDSVSISYPRSIKREKTDFWYKKDIYTFSRCIKERAQRYDAYKERFGILSDSLHLAIYHYFYKDRPASFWRAVDELDINPWCLEDVAWAHQILDYYGCEDARLLSLKKRLGYRVCSRGATTYDTDDCFTSVVYGEDYGDMSRYDFLCSTHGYLDAPDINVVEHDCNILDDFILTLTLESCYETIQKQEIAKSLRDAQNPLPYDVDDILDEI